MISVKEAEDILGRSLLPIHVETVPLVQSLGRVLAEEIAADRDFPPYNRVTMDGIAIKGAFYEKGQAIYRIEKVVAAGDPQYVMNDEASCVEIMTGAVLPKGSDTVIRYEDVTIENGEATILVDNVKTGQNVHMQGSDRREGEAIVPVSRVMGAAEIAVGATVGKTHLKVHKLPSVVIVSTGDELVSIDQKPEPHQIRASNDVMVQAAVRSLGLPVTIRHLADDRDTVRKGVRELLDAFQILIFIGGSSKGKYDYIPETLEEYGVSRYFYKVKQRPGKPFWFGGTDVGRQFVFALPGNPVSCFMCVEKYFKPWLKNSLGIARSLETATLKEEIQFRPPLTYFAPVHLAHVDGQYAAIPMTGQGSGDLANLVDADAFIQLPEDQQIFPAGSTYPIIKYRHLL